MMFLARAGNWDALGASGLISLGSRPNNFCSLSKEASATEPRPMAHLVKKWRRVTSRKGSGCGGWFISFARDGFIKIQQHPRHGGPGGQLLDILLPGFCGDYFSGFFRGGFVR